MKENRCPYCGWTGNRYNADCCDWCGHQLPHLQYASKSDPATLDKRLQDLKLDIATWFRDVSGCFLDKGIDLMWRNMLYEDLLNWLLGKCTKEARVVIEPKEEKSHSDKRTADEKSKQQNQFEQTKQSRNDNGNRQKPNWVFVAGWLFGIILGICIRIIFD